MSTPGTDLLRKAVRAQKYLDSLATTMRLTPEDLRDFASGKDNLSFDELKQLAKHLFGGMFSFDGDALRPVLTKMPAGMFPDPPRPNRFILKRPRLRLTNADVQTRALKRQEQISDDL
ncbi:hypothetical protein [Bradyrhizobium elkanii]